MVGRGARARTFESSSALPFHPPLECRNAEPPAHGGPLFHSQHYSRYNCCLKAMAFKSWPFSTVTPVGEGQHWFPPGCCQTDGMLGTLPTASPTLPPTPFCATNASTIAAKHADPHSRPGPAQGRLEQQASQQPRQWAFVLLYWMLPHIHFFLMKVHSCEKKYLHLASQVVTLIQDDTEPAASQSKPL